MKLIFISFFLVAILALGDGFTTGSLPVDKTHGVALRAKRLIGNFEASDFALATGEWPYTQQDLARMDESNDAGFYDSPRFVAHIDDRAIQSLTDFYRDEMAALALRTENGKVDVLDLCSSWISHLPVDGTVPFGKVVGVGMNRQELAANQQLTSFVVQDLNVNPEMNFEDESFDVICNVVSVDYLTNPRVIFQEMYRILRPGGVALMSFSNRCFPTKAVNMWLQADDIGRITIVGSYFHYSAKWQSIEALDIIPPKAEIPPKPSMLEIAQDPAKGLAWMTAASAVQQRNYGDPMYVVKGVK